MGRIQVRLVFDEANEEYSELFNLKREIIVVLSDYPKFEPRTLDAFDYAKRDRRYQDMCVCFELSLFVAY